MRARTITIKRINPSPPLGQYPQPELYGQAGNAPTNSRTRMINRIVPMLAPFGVISLSRPTLDVMKFVSRFKTE